MVCKCFAGYICVWHNTRMMIPNQTIPGLRGSAAWHTCSKIATGWFCLKPVSWDILGRSPSPTACVEAADLAQRELGRDWCSQIESSRGPALIPFFGELSTILKHWNMFQVSDFMDTSKGAESCHLRMNKPSLITKRGWPPQSQASC